MRKFITIRSYFWIILLLPVSSFAQEVTRIQVPIEKNGEMLKLAGMGGLNAPQISPIDWNQDGLQDLFVFDRIGDVVIPLVHQGGENSLNYKVDWTYTTGLSDFRFWVLVRDYNQDGLDDFFAASVQSGVPGITLYKAIQNGDQISYEKQFFNGRDYFLIQAGGGDTNLYVSWEDIPSIDDMDDDGDLDVVSFDPGGSRITYYQNMSVENGWGLDSFRFVVADACWGKVLESELSETLFLSDNPNSCSTGGFQDPIVQVRHSGSTIATFDQDGDGLKEALIGDITSKAIVFAKNGGTLNQAWINSQDAHWPSYDVEVNLAFFNAAYHLDVNNDALPDVLIGSNTRSFGEKYNVLWYYKNVGTADNQIFELQQKDLFIDEMLDFGSESNPSFADVNADGLIDLVVAGFISDPISLDRIPSLNLLLNVGTSSEPKYRLIDEDYLGMSSFVSLPTWNLTPAFGDLDNDGDIDLIVGDNDGQLFYFENTEGNGQPMQFKPVVYPYQNIDVGGSSAPTIFDADGDDLNDLIIGERNANFDDMGNCGSLSFFKNLGSVGNAIFDPGEEAPNTNCFGRVVLNDVPGIPVYAKPRAIKVNGKVTLFVSDDAGKIRTYSGLENDLYGSFNLENDNFGEIKDGFRTGFDLADIDHDGKLEMVVGNVRGGITFYNTEVSSISTSEKPIENSLINQIKIVPNPVYHEFRLKNDFLLDIKSVSLVNMNGQIVWEKEYTPGQTFSMHSLSPGLYTLIVRAKSGVAVSKMVKL